jgi:hypothetical protein
MDSLVGASDLTDAVTLASVISSNLHEVNGLPDFDQVLPPLRVQHSVFVAAQDPTGFVAKLVMQVRSSGISI